MEIPKNQKFFDIVHSVEGYSTHRIGERNLDMVLAGDFSNSHHVELLLPIQDFTQLDVIRRTKTGSEVFRLRRIPIVAFYGVYASLKLGHPLTMNIAGYSYNGKIHLAVGAQNNEVIFIQP